MRRERVNWWRVVIMAYMFVAIVGASYLIARVIIAR